MWIPTFNRSKSSLHFFSELLARFTSNTLDPFFHTAVRPNGEQMVFWGIEEA